jgi:hypothetical protein
MRIARLVPSLLAAFPIGLASCGGGGGDGDIVIAQISYATSGSVSPALVNPEFTFSLSMNSDPSTRVGDGVVVTPADQGSTFTVGPADDAQFAALAARLMNGVDELLAAEDTEGPGGGAVLNPESVHLVGVAAGYTGPDLVGFVLTRIQIVIDQLSAAPNATGGTDFSFSVRFVFRGYGP